MGYWSDKCFMCYFIGALIAIVSLSTHSIVKQNKKKKKYHKKEITLNSTTKQKKNEVLASNSSIRDHK